MTLTMRILLIILTFPTLLPGHAINWVTDYTGTTNYQAPAGWTISTHHNEHLSTWQAEEAPGVEGSPGLMLLAMMDPGLPLEELTTTLLQEVAMQIEVRNSVTSPTECHLVLQAQISGIPAQLATFAVKNEQLVYVGIFAAPSERFQQLGGADFLYQAVRQGSPYVRDSPTPRQTGALNMQDPLVQNQVLQAGVKQGARALSGVWLQSFSMLSGDDYLTPESTIRTEERGYAHLLDLRPDNTYQLTYRYQSYSAGCPYEAEVVESGRYEIAGTTLKLNRGNYDASYNICGQQSTERKSNLEQKTFQIGCTGQELVLRGTPFEYTISIDNDASGQPYFQEGFRRQ